MREEYRRIGACCSTRTRRSGLAPSTTSISPMRRWSAWRRRIRPSSPMSVEQATGTRPPLPERDADLLHRPEHTEPVAPTLAAVQAAVRARIG